MLAATLKASPQYVEDYLAYMGQEARPASDADASARMVDVLKKVGGLWGCARRSTKRLSLTPFQTTKGAGR